MLDFLAEITAIHIYSIWGQILEMCIKIYWFTWKYEVTLYFSCIKIVYNMINEYYFVSGYGICHFKHIWFCNLCDFLMCVHCFPMMYNLHIDVFSCVCLLQVTFKCGTENIVTSASEPSRCEYAFNFEAPSRCTA